LKNHSYELKFAKPSLADISKLTGTIARKEGCELDNETARYVAEISGQDIRQVINIM
jgi:DNA polymerase III delta prime subunit